MRFCLSGDTVRGMLILAVILVQISGRMVDEPNWCSDQMTCEDGNMNTMCTHKQDHSVKYSTNEEDKQFMLSMHNNFRNKIAAGHIDGWPPAANMRQMSWDKTLEETALVWASQKILAHDICRRTPSFSYVGQNLGVAWSTGIPPHANIIFKAWVDEIKTINADMVDCFVDGAWGHFTQVIWAESYKIGCAEVTYVDDERMNRRIIACNYGPGGNLYSQSIYLRGIAGSNCSLGTMTKSDSKYPSLCDIEEPVDNCPTTPINCPTTPIDCPRTPIQCPRKPIKCPRLRTMLTAKGWKIQTSYGSLSGSLTMILAYYMLLK